MLRLHLDQINALDSAIQDLEARTEKCLDPFRGVVGHLATIPGVREVTATVIVAEIGVDMSCFPIKRRRGPKRAIVSGAASMLTAAYYMIQRDEDFHDLGAGYFDQFDRQKLARRLIRRLHELGLDVDVKHQVA